MSLQPTEINTDRLNEGFVPDWTQADKLRKARELTGLTTTEFAKEIGVSRQAAGMAERGEVTPRRSTLLLWSMRTGVSLKWLEKEEAPTGDDGGLSDVLPRLDSNQQPPD